MTFRTGGTWITFGTALTCGTGRPDARGTDGTRRTYGAGRAWRPRRTVQTRAATFCEQLARDCTCIELTTLFDRSDALFLRDDACLELLHRVGLVGPTRDEHDQRDLVHR